MLRRVSVKSKQDQYKGYINKEILEEIKNAYLPIIWKETIRKWETTNEALKDLQENKIECTETFKNHIRTIFKKYKNREPKNNRNDRSTYEKIKGTIKECYSIVIKNWIKDEKEIDEISRERDQFFIDEEKKKENEIKQIIKNPKKAINDEKDRIRKETHKEKRELQREITEKNKRDYAEIISQMKNAKGQKGITQPAEKIKIEIAEANQKIFNGRIQP